MYNNYNSMLGPLYVAEKAGARDSPLLMPQGEPRRFQARPKGRREVNGNGSCKG